EQRARQLGVTTRASFLGRVAHETLAGLYSAADVLVLASSREGWANVLLEAMACGTPVVASNVWGTPEVVGSSDVGELMSERTPKGVVRAIERLIARGIDRARVRIHAQNFSWDSTTQGQM